MLMYTPPSQTFLNAPLSDLLSVFLRQLRRPLAAHGVPFTDAEAQTWAQERCAGQLTPAPALLAGLAEVVAESEQVLRQLGLSYPACLALGMESVGGWETTGEFLALANEKSNAELRITLAAALGYAFGEQAHYPALLQQVAAGDFGEDSVIASRVLGLPPA